MEFTYNACCFTYYLSFLKSRTHKLLLILTIIIILYYNRLLHHCFGLLSCLIIRWLYKNVHLLCIQTMLHFEYPLKQYLIIITYKNYLSHLLYFETFIHIHIVHIYCTLFENITRFFIYAYRLYCVITPSKIRLTLTNKKYG